MKEISELKAFSKAFEIVHLGAARIIGKETRSGGKLGNTAPALWDEVYSSGVAQQLKKLPQAAGKDLFGWTCEYDESTKTFVYLVCALTPADTPVPEGFTYRDIPETLCAVGKFGESVNMTVKHAAEQGYDVNWAKAGCGWNAELYFDEEEKNPPKKNCKPWHWLVPVREKTVN